ncbi:MAG: DNA-binding protein [Microcella sp.]|uniref:DNA-binding protein n=1 Tax=Microcella sp. TaxID=1913979 RepID=UPI0033155452
MYVVVAAPRTATAAPNASDRALFALRARFDGDYPLAPELVDGALHALTPSARAALETVLHLSRDRCWTVGLGLGSVRTPLPVGVHEVAGPGIVAAHDAASAAARRASACAVRGVDDAAVERLEPLLDLLLAHRARWSAHSWQLHDLLDAGATQAAAAATLGITPQAVSKRARAAGLRVDAEARTALAELLSEAGNRRA